MKGLRLLFIFPVFLLACSSGLQYKKPSEPEEAGSDFIRAALDGDYRKMRLFLLKDRDNERIAESLEKAYRALPEAEKSAFRQARVIVYDIRSARQDSTVYINFANSYKKEKQEIKLVTLEGEWWVDLKYTFTGDSTQPK